MRPPLNPTEMQEAEPAAVIETKSAARKGCIARLLGCVGIGAGCTLLLALFVAIVPGWGARAKRNAVRPGMSASQVLDLCQGWFVSDVQGGTAESPIHLTLPASASGFTLPGGEWVKASNPVELGRRIEDEMKKTGRSWTLGFGYITLVPRRMYFSVEFGPDGRVMKVSDAAWGSLD